jgi:valyl-tRNA synthetase
MQHTVAPSKRVQLLIEASGPMAQLLSENLDLLKSQAMLEEVTFSAPGEGVEVPTDAAALALEGAKIYVLGIIDRQAELVRLQKQAAMLSSGIRSIEAKLNNEGFVSKAPAAVVQKERQRLESLCQDLAAVQNSLNSMK